jgi:hypothetical protein
VSGGELVVETVDEVPVLADLESGHGASRKGDVAVLSSRRGRRQHGKSTCEEGDLAGLHVGWIG